MKQIEALRLKIDALSLRERGILFVLMLAGLWAVLDAALLAPQERMRKAEQQKIERARTQLAEAEGKLAARAGAPDPARDAQQRLAAASQALDARMQSVAGMQARLVAPRERLQVLQGLLAAQPGLRLGRLDTLPPEPVGEAEPARRESAEASASPASAAAVTANVSAAASAALPAMALYKHGVKLTLIGSYDALTRYMERLQALPLGFYWARAELDAGDHPEIRLTLTLYTLSQERTWLTV